MKEIKCKDCIYYEDNSLESKSSKLKREKEISTNYGYTGICFLNPPRTFILQNDSPLPRGAYSFHAFVDKENWCSKGETLNSEIEEPYFYDVDSKSSIEPYWSRNTCGIETE